MTKTLLEILAKQLKIKRNAKAQIACPNQITKTKLRNTEGQNFWKSLLNFGPCLDVCVQILVVLAVLIFENLFSQLPKSKSAHQKYGRALCSHYHLPTLILLKSFWEKKILKEGKKTSGKKIPRLFINLKIDKISLIQAEIPWQFPAMKNNYFFDFSPTARGTLYKLGPPVIWLTTTRLHPWLFEKVQHPGC